MIIYQHRIYRSDLQANPEILYVFGDNVQRVGLGGQAGEMRGEQNAVGVATKWSPGMQEEDFFSDDQFEECKDIILQDLNPVLYLPSRKIVVVPSDGLGTGLSQLPERAPKLYEFLCELGFGGPQVLARRAFLR